MSESKKTRVAGCYSPETPEGEFFREEVRNAFKKRPTIRFDVVEPISLDELAKRNGWK